MPSLPQPCLTCGQLSTNGPRCPLHTQQVQARWTAQRTQTKASTGQYKGAYARLSRIVRETAIICHLCNKPFQPGDKVEADHLYPGTPVTDISQLAPAHSYCNQSRGNNPLHS